MPTTRSSGTTTARNTSRAASSARNQIIEMLKDDHKRAKKAFRDFERLDAQKDTEQCRQLVEQTCKELTVHSTLEEELLYPAAKDALPEPDLVLEAEVEHASLKQLIEQLEAMSPDDEKFSATFTVLAEYVKHHVKEEEGEMFPRLGKARQVDWEALCDEMNGRRAELLSQLLPELAEAEAELDEDAPAAGQRSASAGAATARKSSGAHAGEGRAQAASAASKEPRSRTSSDDAKGDEETGSDSD